VVGGGGTGGDFGCFWDSEGVGGFGEFGYLILDGIGWRWWDAFHDCYECHVIELLVFYSYINLR
jgi:hypothetical protein